MCCCRWKIGNTNVVAKRTAPRNTANMALMQAGTMVTVPTTVLTKAATTMETITVLTITDIQTTFMAAATTSVSEYRKYIWRLCVMLQNKRLRESIIFLLFFLYGYKHSYQKRFNPICNSDMKTYKVICLGVPVKIKRVLHWAAKHIGSSLRYSS